MVMLPQPFSPAATPPDNPQAGNLPVSGPEGHLVQIVDSELVPTQNNPNSGMLVLHLQILEGPATGQTGVYRLNLYHETSQQADSQQHEDEYQSEFHQRASLPETVLPP